MLTYHARTMIDLVLKFRLLIKSLVILLFIAMLFPSIKSTLHTINNQKIVICGCGITGSIISNLLIKEKATNLKNEVHVYEAGRGPGGRSSTRHFKEFNFDHGAQYIKESSNVKFKSWLNDLDSNGIIKQWNGNFIDYIISSNENIIKDNCKNRYIGYPTMSNICKYLIKSPDIHANFNSRIKASYNTVNKKWNIYDTVTNNLVLDDVDWLISTDKSSFLSLINPKTFSSVNDNDISTKITNLFDIQKQIISTIETIPILSAMVVLKSKLPYDLFPYDSITISDLNNNDNNNIIGWISRDSSKPGRQRNDDKECWVIQSTSIFAQQVIKEVNKTIENTGCYTPEELKIKVNKVANDKLVDAFIEFIAKMSSNKLDAIYMRSIIEESIGHRWGAAFPIKKSLNKDISSIDRSISSNTITKSKVYDDITSNNHPVDINNDCYNKNDELEMYCYVNKDLKFAATGDYFNEVLLGRIESSYLSGSQVVDMINNISIESMNNSS